MKIKFIITLFSIATMFALTLNSDAQTKNPDKKKKAKTEKTHTEKAEAEEIENADDSKSIILWFFKKKSKQPKEGKVAPANVKTVKPIKTTAAKAEEPAEKIKPAKDAKSVKEADVRPAKVKSNKITKTKKVKQTEAETEEIERTDDSKGVIFWFFKKKSKQPKENKSAPAKVKTEKQIKKPKSEKTEKSTAKPKEKPAEKIKPAKEVKPAKPVKETKSVKDADAQPTKVKPAKVAKPAKDAKSVKDADAQPAKVAKPKKVKQTKATNNQLAKPETIKAKKIEPATKVKTAPATVVEQPKGKTLSDTQVTELNAAMQTIQSILKEYDDAKTVQSNDIEKISTKPTRTKVDRGIKQKTFVSQGSLIIGGTIGYNQFKASDYEFLMIKDIEANVYTTGAKVSAAWTFTDDIAAGIMFDYSRIQANFDNIDINLSEDMVFSIKDYKSIRHVYTASAFLRTYINIGNSGRFGMFNDVRVSFGGGEGKILNGEGKELVGTYEKIQTIGFNLAPGIAVFATDFLAIGASVGILGFNYSKTEQITNQVYQGSFESFSANFKINLLSVNLGLQFYF